MLLKTGTGAVRSTLMDQRPFTDLLCHEQISLKIPGLDIACACFLRLDGARTSIDPVYLGPHVVLRHTKYCFAVQRHYAWQISHRAPQPIDAITNILCDVIPRCSQLYIE